MSKQTTGREIKELDEDILATEKAKHMRIMFLVMPDELPIVGTMTFSDMSKLANIEALVAVNILINERVRRPASFWKKVKSKLENHKS